MCLECCACSKLAIQRLASFHLFRPWDAGSEAQTSSRTSIIVIQQQLFHQRRTAMHRQFEVQRCANFGVACDRTGKAIPWYTYPATDFLLNAIFGIRQSLSSEADSSLPTNWRISAIRRVPLPIAKCWTLALVGASDTILLRHDSFSSIVST